MSQWIFLASIGQAINLSHFVAAHLADDGSINLISDNPRQNNVLVTNKKDVAKLRAALKVQGGDYR